MKQVLYLAKEPDNGVMSDLKSLKKHKVTVVACLPGYREYYQFLGYNTITADQYFSLEDMKFDVIIGNPPYQESNHKAKTSSLWKSFLNQSVELCDGKISLIVPASFTSPTKLFNQYKNRLSLVDLTVKKYFRSVGSSFCRFVLENDEQDTCEVITSGGTYQLKLNNWDCIPSTLDDNLISLVDKYFTNVDGKWRVSYEYDQRKPYITKDGPIEILHSTRILYTHKDHPNNHTYRVFCTITNGTKFNVCEPGKGLSQNNIWIPCESLSDAKTLCDKLNQSDIQRLLKSFQYSNMNYVQIINKLNII